MKLFGGKKGNKQNAEPVEQNEIVAVPEVAAEAEVSDAVNADVPEITLFPEQVAEEIVVPAEISVEQNDSENKVGVIADAFGVPAEELEVKESKAEVLAEEPVVEKKLTRKEKKTAKKADKEAAKAEKKLEKKAEKAAKKEARKWSLGKKIFVVFLLLLAIALTALAGYFVSRLWITEDQLDIYTADFQGEIITGDETENPIDGDDDGEDNTVEVDSTRKKGCYTFLVAGRDVETGLCDVVIIGRLNTEEGSINMVSIPRDTMINKGNLKINTAYLGDLSSGGNGIDGLLKEVKKICGFDVDSWAVVDVEAVAKLIDAVGGVYFDVPMDMQYKDGAQGLVIDIKAGYQHLSGEDAVKVLRFRKGYAQGDLGRIQTQHDLILALAEQMLDLGNIPNLGTLIDIYQEHVQTNLTPGNVLFYAKEFLKLDFEKIQFVDMPQMAGGLVNGQSYIFINITKWVDTVNEYLNPYKENITQRNVSIKSSGDRGESFHYSAGA